MDDLFNNGTNQQTNENFQPLSLNKHAVTVISVVIIAVIGVLVLSKQGKASQFDELKLKEPTYEPIKQEVAGMNTESTGPVGPFSTPTAEPSASPSASPTLEPTPTPTVTPTSSPTSGPTNTPTPTPTVTPTPTTEPSQTPTVTVSPTPNQ